MLYEMHIGIDQMYEKYISTKRTELNRIAKERMKEFPNFRILKFEEKRFVKAIKNYKY